MISIKYESFDVNSSNEAFNKPNFTIIGESNISEVDVIAKDNEGNIQKLHLVSDGKGWSIENVNIYTSDEDFVKEYFDKCIEDNGFDNKLLEEMSNKYYIDIAKLKSIIAFYRHKYINNA